MQVTANARCRKLVVGFLARAAIEKRRSLNWDTRSSTERVSKKAAPPVSPVASDEMSEAEAIRRAREAVAPCLSISIGYTAGVCMPYACAW